MKLQNMSERNEITKHVKTGTKLVIQIQKISDHGIFDHIPGPVQADVYVCQFSQWRDKNERPNSVVLCISIFLDQRIHTSTGHED